MEGSREALPQKSEPVSVSHNDFEALAEEQSVQCHLHELPPDIKEGDIVTVVNAATHGRLPVEVVAVVRLNGEGFVTLKKHIPQSA